MGHEAVLSFTYDDAERASRVERSLRPEVGDIADDRTRTTLERDDGCVRVRVVASDLIRLRAGLNTWTSLVSVAESVDGLDS